MGDKLTKSSLFDLICATNLENIELFKTQYLSEINQFAKEIYTAYELYKQIDEQCIGDERRSYISAYFFNSIKNLIDSFNLLLQGYLIPSGNLMRHFFESAEIAILISNHKLNYLNKFIKGKIKANQAERYITKDLNKFKIEEDKWNEWKENKKFYHLYSHPTIMALTDVFNFSSGNIALGANYDLAKMQGYDKGIKFRISAVTSLQNIIVAIQKQLNDV